jgi:opacity protein-like surface antigen
MKKLILTASALVLGLSLAMPAMADCNGVYVAGRGGVFKNHFKKKQTHDFDQNGMNKNKLMLSGAVGYRYDYWRTELEYVWRDKNKFENDFFKRQFRTYSGMWNNYIDILPYEWISPYAGVGIGYTKLKYSAKDKFENTVIRSDKKTNFTWSLGAGVTVKVTNRINVDAGYRYYDIGSFGHEDVTLQEIYGGLRYVF